MRMDVFIEDKGFLLHRDMGWVYYSIQKIRRFILGNGSIICMRDLVF
jgi:hypothetical protein